MLTPPPPYYTETPMHDFNHRNPWVHICTKLYGECHDDIEGFTRSCLQLGISVVGVFLGILLTTIIQCVIHGMNVHSIMTIIGTIAFLFCDLYTAYTLFNFLRYLLKDNKAMKRFKEISDMKMSEIVTIELEVVVDGIYLLREFKGEILSEFKWRKRMIYTLLFSEIMVLCVNIVFLFL